MEDNILDHKVSIVILCWNHLEDVTKPFLEQIVKTIGVQYELVFIDNGSTDGTYEYIKEYLHGSLHRIYRSETNLGFARGNNMGLNITTGEYICFLNNDVVVKNPEWLRNMLNYAIEHQDTLIGTKSKKNVLLQTEMISPIDYLEGWCLMAKKSIFEEHGCWHNAFEKPFFEDVELCYRLNKRGIKLKEIDIGLIHLGSRSLYDQLEVYTVIRDSSKLFWGLVEKLKSGMPLNEYLFLKNSDILK